jgi:uncharacterized protein YbjT (DUF2867 family)
VACAPRAILAAKAAGARFVLVLSSTAVGEEGVAIGRQLRQVEGALAASRLGWCVLRVPLLVDSALASAGSVKAERVLRGAADPFAHATSLALADLCEAAVCILLKPSRTQAERMRSRPAGTRTRRSPTRSPTRRVSRLSIAGCRPRRRARR